MAEGDEILDEIIQEVFQLCDSDPDAGLELIEKMIESSPELESNPLVKFAKATAYLSKGLRQLAKRQPWIDFTVMDGEELRNIYGITDMHLDYLEKGLQEIKEMEEIDPEVLEMFGEGKVDGMALVLERCRPGRVQQILGKTKLKYFGPKRILVTSSVADISREDFGIFGDVFFTFHSIVRTALLVGLGKDCKGRKYVMVGLCERTPDNAFPGETIGEQLGLEGLIYLFDDRTFGNSLPTEQEEKKQPKRKGFFKTLFG